MQTSLIEESAVPLMFPDESLKCKKNSMCDLSLERKNGSSERPSSSRADKKDLKASLLYNCSVLSAPDFN